MTETALETKSEPDLDEELLAEAMRGVGSTSRNETLNEALREYVEAKRDRRGQAYDNMQRMAEEGLLDFDALEAVDE